MASINIRNGKLVINLRFKGIRCREQTLLEDTAKNRATLQKLINKIEAEITLGSFNYAAYFPNSPQVNKFIELDEQNRKLTDSTLPLFKDFAWEWYEEMEVGWRNSHIRPRSNGC